MPVRKALIILILVALWYGVGAESQNNAYYSKYALDGVPLAIFHASKTDEVWVVTDAASLLQVRWQEGILKNIPLSRKAKGAFQRLRGGVVIWFETNDIQWYNSSGNLAHQMKVSDGTIRHVRETKGGYILVECSLVEKEKNTVVLYSPSGNRLLEWKREGATSLPIQISDEDTILDAEETGHCVIRRLDGTVLTKLHFPHPLRIVSWVKGPLLLGVSPDGKATLLNQEGNELHSRILFRQDSIPSSSMIKVDEESAASYIDQEGVFHWIPLEDESGSAHLSFPLDLNGNQVTALSFAGLGTSFCAGDSQWVLHWIRVSDKKLFQPSSITRSQLPLLITPLFNPAEQYFVDLANSPFLQKNLQLIEEAKEFLRRGNLQWILLGLKKGLQALIAREELGVSIRVEAAFLLGRIGDGFDGEWLGKRLIREKEEAVRRSILEALHLLATALNSTTRKDLFTYLRNKRNTLELTDLQLSLSLLERWTKVSGLPLQQDELEQLSFLAAESPQYTQMILKFIRK